MKILLSVLLVIALPAAAAEWTRHACPVDDHLHNGCFVGAKKGWILSYGTGLLLHTADGGESWQVQARFDSLFYEEVFFLDEMRG